MFSKYFTCFCFGLIFLSSALSAETYWMHGEGDQYTPWEDERLPDDSPTKMNYPTSQEDEPGLRLSKFVIPAGIAATGMTIAVVKSLQDCPEEESELLLQFTGSFTADTGAEVPGDTTLTFEILYPNGTVFYSDSLISGDSTSGDPDTFETSSTALFRSGDEFIVNVTGLVSTGNSDPISFTVNGLYGGEIFDPQTAAPPLLTTTFTFTVP